MSALLVCAFFWSASEPARTSVFRTGYRSCIWLEFPGVAQPKVRNASKSSDIPFVDFIDAQESLAIRFHKVANIRCVIFCAPGICLFFRDEPGAGYLKIEAPALQATSACERR
jgi:hypothetical protein